MTFFLTWGSCKWNRSRRDLNIFNNQLFLGSNIKISLIKIFFTKFISQTFFVCTFNAHTHPKWWIAFASMFFPHNNTAWDFNLIYQRIVNQLSLSLGRMREFSSGRKMQKSGNWKKCRKLSTTTLIDDFSSQRFFLFISLFLPFQLTASFPEWKFFLHETFEKKSDRKNIVEKFLYKFCEWWG